MKKTRATSLLSRLTLGMCAMVSACTSANNASNAPADASQTGFNGGATGGTVSDGGVASAGSSGATGSAGSGGATGIPSTGPAPDGEGPAKVDGLDVGDPSKDILDEIDVGPMGATLHFWLWLPGGVTIIRGLEVNVQQGQHYVEFGRLVNFGILSFDQTQYHDVSASAETLVTAAATFATRTHHPELVNAVFVGTGHSASSAATFALDEQMPERLVAGGSGGLEFTPGTGSGANPDASRRVPYMLFFGAGDGSQPMVISQNDLPAARTSHALFGIAPQWGGGHSIGTSPNIILPMWYQSIARRYPTDQDPTKGPVKLNDLPENGGWLGSTATWRMDRDNLITDAHTVSDVAPFDKFTGDKGNAIWLLDSYMAHVWQAHVAPDDTVALTDLVPLNKDDSKSTITLLEPGAKLSVTATVGSVPSPLAALDLYDGDLKLATSTENPHKFDNIVLPAGVHGILAVAHLQNGQFLTSHVTAIMSIRHSCPPVMAAGGFPARCIAK